MDSAELRVGLSPFVSRPVGSTKQRDERRRGWGTTYFVTTITVDERARLASDSSMVAVLCVEDPQRGPGVDCHSDGSGNIRVSKPTFYCYLHLPRRLTAFLLADGGNSGRCKRSRVCYTVTLLVSKALSVFTITWRSRWVSIIESVCNDARMQ